MTDADALLAAIRAAPDDDAPRLVYADWLDEHGQPERAEFIRVQCELAHRESSAMRRREAELLTSHHDAFAEDLAMPGFRFRFQRGFVTGFGHAGVFLSAQKTLAWSVMLRFFPHGLVMSANWTSLTNLSAHFESSNPQLRKGQYIVDPFADPTEIRLKFGIRSWTEQGVLEGNDLTITQSRHGSQAKSLKKYTHVSIPGFDSFTET